MFKCSGVVLKVVLAVCFAFLLNLQAYSAENDYALAETNSVGTQEGWKAFQVGLLPDYPKSIINSRVNGLKLGLPFSGGRLAVVNGLELSLLASSTYTVDGAQLALLACIANDMNGAQMTVLTSVSRRMGGFQLSLVNVARELDGWQTALFNAVTYTAEGVQLGLVNSAQNVEGVQIGLFNITVSEGFQIGLFNVIEDGWLPFSILVNWSFK